MLCAVRKHDSPLTRMRSVWVLSGVIALGLITGSCTDLFSGLPIPTPIEKKIAFDWVGSLPPGVGGCVTAYIDLGPEGGFAGDLGSGDADGFSYEYHGASPCVGFDEYDGDYCKRESYEFKLEPDESNDFMSPFCVSVASDPNTVANPYDVILSFHSYTWEEEVIGEGLLKVAP